MLLRMIVPEPKVKDARAPDKIDPTEGRWRLIGPHITKPQITLNSLYLMTFPRLLHIFHI